MSMREHGIVTQVMDIGVDYRWTGDSCIPMALSSSNDMVLHIAGPCGHSLSQPSELTMVSLATPHVDSHPGVQEECVVYDGN